MQSYIFSVISKEVHESLNKWNTQACLYFLFGKHHWTSEWELQTYSKLSPLPQFFLKPQNTFGGIITFKKVNICSSWLCWRAKPAGFPNTTAAAANKPRKILSVVRGKSYIGNTPGSRGERILPCEGRDPDRRPKSKSKSTLMSHMHICATFSINERTSRTHGKVAN